METMSTLLFLLAWFVTVFPMTAEDSVQATSGSYPVHDPRRSCLSPENKNLFRLEVIPGGGWDNLRNKDAGMVMRLNYSQCLTTDDGRYLVPDGIYTIPKKSSQVDTYAELFTHWNNYSSTLSSSVNAHAGIHFSHVGISGKYSKEYEKIKTRQFFDKSATTRVQIRFVRYTARTQPDFALDDTFKARLRKIAAHLELNRTDLATYESQMVVRDFGTHVITSVDIGAALVQVDHVKQSFLKTVNQKNKTVQAAAGANFFKVVGFGHHHSRTVSGTTFDEYLKNRTDSQLSTYGGPTVWPLNQSDVDWDELLNNDMVALDRSGDPIYLLISTTTLPGLPESTVFKVHDYIRSAVELYYQYNVYPGCLDRDSPNFSFTANEEDGSCKPPSAIYTFGGVYQTCSSTGGDNLCEELQQTNPLTGDYSCPEEYETVLLQTGTKRFSQTRKKCHRCKMVHHCCSRKTYFEYATYKAYWCAPKDHAHENRGFLFGGLYTSTMYNPVTKDTTCPSRFYPLQLLTDLIICVSDDYEQDLKNSLPFAGFFSCKSGNPLVLEAATILKPTGSQDAFTKYTKNQEPLSWSHECPSGFSQHLATVEDGCEVNYCIKTGALSFLGLPKIKRPPFMKLPHDSYLLEDADESEFIFSDDGNMWTLTEAISIEESTSVEKPDGKTGNLHASGSMDSGQTESLSVGTVAGIAVAAALTIVCIIILAIALYRKRGHRNMLGNRVLSYQQFDSRDGASEDSNLLHHVQES